MKTELEQIIEWGKDVRWLTPLDKHKILQLVYALEAAQSSLETTQNTLLGRNNQISSTETLHVREIEGLVQQLSQAQEGIRKLTQELATKEESTTLELNRVSDQSRLDQSTIADLNSQMTILTSENSVLRDKEKSLESSYYSAVASTETANLKCQQIAEREQALTTQAKELQETVGTLNRTLTEIPNKDLWLTRDAELISLRTALNLALQATPDKVSICDQVGKGCILHTGCMVMEAKRALSSACANKLVARIQALEKVVSQAHPHSLDYKCIQCDTLKQARIDLAVLDGNN